MQPDVRRDIQPGIELERSSCDSARITLDGRSSMLSVRLAVVTAIAALCLWGLFQLLDNLREPGLLRTEKAVVLKGCDTPESQSDSLCAQLRCQKSLLEQKLVPLRTGFQMLPTADGWIGGQALDPGSRAVLGYFACKRASTGVIAAAQWLDEPQFQALQ